MWNVLKRKREAEDKKELGMGETVAKGQRMCLTEMGRERKFAQCLHTDPIQINQ